MIFAVTPRARMWPHALAERRRQLRRDRRGRAAPAADRSPRRRARVGIVSPVLEDDAGRRGRRSVAMRATRAPRRIVAPAFSADCRERAAVSAPGPPAQRDAAADGHRVLGEPLQKHRAGAGRPRPREVAEDRARGERRLKQIGLEPLADEIGDGHRQPAREPRQSRARRGRARAVRGPHERASSRRRRSRSIGGGAWRSSGAITSAIRCVIWRNSRQRPASRADSWWIDAAVSTASRWNIEHAPSGPSDVSAGSGVTNRGRRGRSSSARSRDVADRSGRARG